MLEDIDTSEEEIITSQHSTRKASLPEPAGTNAFVINSSSCSLHQSTFIYFIDARKHITRPFNRPQWHNVNSVVKNIFRNSNNGFYLDMSLAEALIMLQ